MDMTDKRRAQLKRLCDEKFGGVIARLAEAIDRAPSYVSRVLSGKKGIKEDFCRHVEQSLELPGFWMDGLSDGEMPADVSTQLIDATFMHQCMQAVDAYRDKERMVVTDEMRTRFACDLYSVFQPVGGASIDQMRTFLKRWTAIIAERRADAARNVARLRDK